MWGCCLNWQLSQSAGSSTTRECFCRCLSPQWLLTNPEPVDMGGARGVREWAGSGEEKSALLGALPAGWLAGRSLPGAAEVAGGWEAVFTTVPKM